MQDKWIRDSENSRKLGNQESMQKRVNSFANVIEIGNLSDQLLKVYAEMAWHWALALSEN